MPVAGVEPARGISPPDFESGTSANSITPAYVSRYCIITERRVKIKSKFLPAFLLFLQKIFVWGALFY